MTWPRAGATLPDGIGGRLHHETEGLPLFLAAYLETLAQSGESGRGGAWPVPRGVVDLLRSRLGRGGRGAASAPDRGGHRPLLRPGGITGDQRPQRRRSRIRAGVLANRGIIIEVAEDPRHGPRYDFTHEKLRALVYEETSLARRRLLHGRAARSLAKRARLRRDLAARPRRSAGTSGWPAWTPTRRSASSWRATMPAASMPTPKRSPTTRTRWRWATPKRDSCTKRSVTCTRSWGRTPRRWAVTKPPRRCARRQTAGAALAEIERRSARPRPPRRVVRRPRRTSRPR